MITAKYELKNKRRSRLRQVIRRKLNGTPERPRLIMVKSNKYLYAQAIDDLNHRVLTAVTTLEKELKSKLKSSKDKQAAKLMGEVLADRLKAKAIETVIFDRNTYAYAGRVKIFADAARQKGIRF